MVLQAWEWAVEFSCSAVMHRPYDVIGMEDSLPREWLQFLVGLLFDLYVGLDGSCII